MASIFVNYTQQLTATVSPSNATNKTVSWSSNNTSVATVNSAGLVTGVATGSATITVTTQDGGKTATSAITVISGIGSVLGLNTIGGNPENGDKGYWIANSFTAVSNMTVNRMNLYVSNASGNARFGIYSDNSGYPGTLLAQTGEISLSNGWNSGILGSSQNLTSGITYWLAIEVNSSATTLYYNPASGRLKYIGYTYGSLPSSAPVGCASGVGIYSIYADNSGGATVLVTGVSVSPTSASISVNATQQLTATVSPSNATNQTVSSSSNKTSVATVNSAGLVTGVAAGSATITVTTQDGGKTATSVITVNQPPIVSISAPVTGAIFTALASVTITASATEAGGTVTMVDFYQGNTLLGSDNTNPYSYSWTNVAEGNYTITAKATDNLGASTTSSPITITVSAPIKSLLLDNTKSGELLTTTEVETAYCTIMIPNGFSPNGDGINDYFKITCIDKYPDAKLRIYSRTSVLVYEQQHYGNLDFWGIEAAAWWDGRNGNNSNSVANKLAPGSYIYILDLDRGRKDMIKSGVVFISW